MKNRIFLVNIILSLLLVGCSTSSQYNASNNESAKTYIGMASGGIIGGVTGAYASSSKGGARYTSAAIGALVGALIGGGIGVIMDQKDHQEALALSDKGKKQSGSVAGDWQHATTSVNENAVSVPKAKKDKKLGFWKGLPSTQWFFNDSEQAELS
jgi:outer membrane lipoprotein SlyB